MLQFITHPNDRYNIVEQVKMVLEGGCRWIQLHMNESTNEEVKSIAEELIPLCKELDAILVIEDNIELVKELEIPGVHLTTKHTPAAKARNLLEGGPIIGVTVNTAGDILALKGIDVDYVGINLPKSKEELGNYHKIIKQIRDAGIELPIVAIGDITLEDIDEIMLIGVNGIATSNAIINAENPIEYTKAMLEKLYLK